MHTFNTIFTKSSITHMPQEQFSYIRNILFLRRHIIGIFRISSQLFINSFINLSKHILNWLSLIRTNSANISLSRLHIQFDTCKSGSILPTIVLFLHHQIHFLYPIKGRTILFFVIFKRFKQSN